MDSWKENWKKKWKTATAEVGVVLSDIFTTISEKAEEAMDNVQAQADVFFDDPMGVSEQVAASVRNEVVSVASEFVTYVGAGNMSGEFYDWLMVLSQVTTKEDVDRMVEVEVERLKAHMKGIHHRIDDRKFIREFMIRVYFCEMLGHPVRWAYHTFINLAAVSPRLIDKRIGYLCAASFLQPDDDILVLCINSFIRDLRSDDRDAIAFALHCMCSLMNEEAIPAVWDLILEKLEHKEAYIRKKAVMAVKRVIQVDYTRADGLALSLKKALCDRDPSVMATTLNVYDYLAEKDPSEYKEIIPSLVAILKQVIEHCLPADFDWKGVPGPWIQIKLLRVLCKLARGDRKASEHMYQVVGATLQLADATKDSGRAIKYEAIITIAKIYPNDALLQQATEELATFIYSPDHDLKYLGLKALNEIILIDKKYATDDNIKMAVLDCLESKDDTIRFKTLQLLYGMANKDNAVVIAGKILKHLKMTTDRHLREDLVLKLTSLCEQYSPDNEWFVRMMNKIFIVGGDLVTERVAFNMLILIAEGSTGGEDEQLDSELRAYAVNSFFRLAEKFTSLSPILMKVISWTLGEYAYVVDAQEEAIDLMCDFLEREHKDKGDVRLWVVNALIKLVSQTQNLPPQVKELVTKYSNSQDSELQHRCVELLLFTSDDVWFKFMKSVLPQDASCWDLEVDEDMAFLDDYIQDAIEKGEVEDKPYIEPSEREKVINRYGGLGGSKIELKYIYEAPDDALESIGDERSIFDSIGIMSVSSQQYELPPESTSFSDLASNSKMRGGWGKTGYGTLEVALEEDKSLRIQGFGPGMEKPVAPSKEEKWTGFGSSQVRQAEKAREATINSFRGKEGAYSAPEIPYGNADEIGTFMKRAPTINLEKKDDEEKEESSNSEESESPRSKERRLKALKKEIFNSREVQKRKPKELPKPTLPAAVVPQAPAAVPAPQSGGFGGFGGASASGGFAGLGSGGPWGQGAWGPKAASVTPTTSGGQLAATPAEAVPTKPSSYKEKEKEKKKKDKYGKKKPVSTPKPTIPTTGVMPTTPTTMSSVGLIQPQQQLLQQQLQQVQQQQMAVLQQVQQQQEMMRQMQQMQQLSPQPQVQQLIDNLALQVSQLTSQLLLLQQQQAQLQQQLLAVDTTTASGGMFGMAGMTGIGGMGGISGMGLSGMTGMGLPGLGVAGLGMSTPGMLNPAALQLQMLQQQLAQQQQATPATTPMTATPTTATATTTATNPTPTPVPAVEATAAPTAVVEESKEPTRTDTPAPAATAEAVATTESSNSQLEQIKKLQEQLALLQQQQQQQQQQTQQPEATTDHKPTQLLVEAEESESAEEGLPTFSSEIILGNGFELENLQDTKSVKYLKKVPSTSETQVLVDRPTISITYKKLFLENALEVAVFVTNKSSGELSTIQHLLVPTPNLAYKIIDKDSCHKVDGNKIHVVTHVPSQTVSIFIISIEKFQFTMQGSITITTSFHCSLDDGNTFLKYELPISLFDMLRYQAMDVAEFGDLWADHGRETFLDFPVINVVSSQDICRIMETVNWKAVGVKGEEVLFAAVEVSQSELCLVWLQVNPNSNVVQLKIRVDDNSLQALLAKALKKLLTNTK